MNDKLAITYEKPADWMPSERGTLDTLHLPADVTSQPVAVAVWSTTERINEEGRPEGFFTRSLTIGGRDNPALTADERQYVAALLEKAARLFRSGHWS